MKSAASTVDQYLTELSDERRAALEVVRQVILTNLPKGYVEAMNWGMITYQVPLSVYPDTYNKKPLMYAALASQKKHMAVYLIGIYMDDQVRRDFESKYRSTGKKFDVGKSCVRFRKLDDLPLPLVGEAIATYTEAIRLDPTSERYAARAQAFQAERDCDRAIADYSEAIRLDPQDGMLYLMRARMYRLKGEAVLAAEDERKIQELHK